MAIIFTQSHLGSGRVESSRTSDRRQKSEENLIYWHQYRNFRHPRESADFVSSRAREHCGRMAKANCEQTSSGQPIATIRRQPSSMYQADLQICGFVLVAGCQFSPPHFGSPEESGNELGKSRLPCALEPNELESESRQEIRRAGKRAEQTNEPSRRVSLDSIPLFEVIKVSLSLRLHRGSGELLRASVLAAKLN